MIYLVLFITLFYVLCVSEAVREAYFEHSISKIGSKINCEVKYSYLTQIQRALILLIMIFFVISFVGELALVLVVGILLTLPHIHNVTYFVIRNRLNPNIFIEKENCDFVSLEERPTFYINKFWRNNLAFLGIILQVVGVYLLL